MPTVSVIIPNFNHAAFLKQRIDSVLNQTYQDFEVIILDDASTDNSRSIIEAYRQNLKISHIILNESNSGSTFMQWKTGIELAKGKYIWIAESDDYNENSFLEIAVSRLVANKSVLFFCQSYDVDANNIVRGDFFCATKHFTEIDWNAELMLPSGEFIQKTLQYQNVIINASCVVFVNIAFDFRKIIRYKTCGDWLFWINILNEPSRLITYSPLKLNYFRTHQHTTRHVNNTYKQVQKVLEELSIKYELYKLNLISRDKFRLAFSEQIDLLIPYFGMYRSICKRLQLPNYFIFQFLKRKAQLKLLKIKKAGFPNL